MRLRIAVLLIFPIWVAAAIFLAASGECGGGGGCIATVRVNDDRYVVSVARGMQIEESDLTAYKVATRVNAGSPVLDNQTYQLGAIDPTKVLVMKTAPGQPDAGPYLLLVDFDDSSAWNLTCPYFQPAYAGRPTECSASPAS